MRSRSITIYSLEDLNRQNKQAKATFERIEEDTLSSKSTYASCVSSSHNNSLFHQDREDEEGEEGEEEENERIVIDDLSLLNSIYHSEHRLLNNDLTSIEVKVVCKCLKNSISTNTPLFYKRSKHKQFQTINSLKDIEIKRFLQLLFKAESASKTQNNSVQNYLYQNLEGEQEIKLLISSNSEIEKSKIVSQLLSHNEDTNPKKRNEEQRENSKDKGNDHNDDDDEDDGLGAKISKPISPLTITKKRLIYQNKAIDLEIFDTQLNFYKQKTSTIYYKIAKVFLVIVDNEKCNTPLAFTQIIHRQYEQHASSNRKLIILDVNSNPEQKNIELYCKQQGLIYIRLDKNYSHLPEALINFIFLFTNQKQKKEDAIDWTDSDCLKSGIDYNIEEAFNEAAPKKNNKRAMSLFYPNFS